MPLFTGKKGKLQQTINDAADDPGEYNNVYSMFARQPDSAAISFNHIMSSVSDKDSGGLLSRIGGGRKKRGVDSDDVERLIDLLAVLQGIVMTYPRHMLPIFKDRSRTTVILRTICSTSVPLAVREALLCMVSNWCVLYFESPSAKANLEAVVDRVRERVQMQPKQNALPRPAVTHEQEGWTYPQVRTPSEANFPPDVLARALENPGPLVEQQQREAIEEALPEDKSQLQERIVLTDTLIKHMEGSAQELQSLCSMLTENLVALNVEEDPRSNAIVSELMKDVDERSATINNYMGMLGDEDRVEILAKLSASIDEASRVHWLVDNSVAAHKEWRATQESSKSPRMDLGDITGEGSSASFADEVMSRFAQTTIDDEHSPAVGSASDVLREQKSSKARGKMAL
ncbi:hypothetical protein EC988_001596 [Linderina pennispora]|nr:hypothetical protein EC988_001596 [Linderina pennispora]